MFALGAGTLGGGAALAQTQSTAFVGVTVVPMDTERILEGQTVLVSGGRIVTMGPVDSVTIPSGTIRIGAPGRFLMPGLADLHVHLFSRDELPLYVANGVTVVRNMWGWSLHLELRDAIRQGDVIGPRIYTAGALLDGDPPRLRGSAGVGSPEQAEPLVAKQVEDGYDFLKVYDDLSVAAYEAILEAARRHRVPVAGHVPAAVGLERVLASGQTSIEHLSGFAGRLGSDSAASWSSGFDPQRTDRLAGEVRQAGVWNVPTLVVLDRLDMSAKDSELFLAGPEVQLLPSGIRRFCCSRARDAGDDLPPEIRRYRKANRLSVVGALHRAGANLLLGTDTGNPFVLPGFAVHDELALLVAAGLSPYEAIASSTRLAAEFLKGSAEWGTVAPGKQADLILLSANPLLDVSAISAPLGVMIRGRWLSAEQLRSMVEEAAGKTTR